MDFPYEFKEHDNKIPINAWNNNINLQGKVPRVGVSDL